MLSRCKITVIYNTDNQLGNKAMELTKYPFLIGLADTNGLPFLDPDTIYSIIPKVWKSAYQTDANGKQQAVPTYTNYDVPFKQCNLLAYNSSDVLDIYKKIPYQSAWKCFDPNENLTLYGLFGGFQPNFYITFYINKCVNSTVPGSPICKPKEEIERKLDTAFLSYNYMDFKINNNNITTAAQRYLRTDSLIVSSTIYKRFMIKFKQIDYKTDYGYVFTDYQTDNFYTIEPFYENVDNRVVLRYPGNFCSMTLSVSSNIDLYVRFYTKLQDVMANIGGVLQGILFISVLICHYFSQKLFYASLANEVINYDDVNQGRKRKFTMNLNLNIHSLKFVKKATIYGLDNDLKSVRKMSNLGNNTLINHNESGMKLDMIINELEEKPKHNSYTTRVMNNYLNKGSEETK